MSVEGGWGGGVRGWWKNNDSGWGKNKATELEHS